MDVFLGADLGTSGLKLAAVDAAGTVVAESEAAYPVQTPQPGWAETDPGLWVAAFHAAAARLAGPLRGRRVAGLGVDGQMHGLVLVDSAGRACRPAMLWPDRRAEPVLGAWRALPPDLRAGLANPLVAGMTGPMLAWVLAHEPRAVRAAASALLPKDYLRLHLGGPPVTDRSDASATLLWDVPADAWSGEAVDRLGLPHRLLPDVLASDAVVGSAHLSEVGAGDAPLVTGAADTPAALLAAGGLAPGEVQVNLGTGAQVLCGVAAPHPSAEPVTHLYADAGHGWYAMAAVQNAGLALDRVRLLLELSWEDLFAAAATAPPGAGGVSFLPFLTGERGGIAGPGSRGGWLGISDRTTRADLARAAVEGMLFAVRRAVDLLDAAPARVRLTGGGGRQPLVRQALADLLGAEIAVVPTRSASAIGAAMLAARGCGTPLPVLSVAGHRVEAQRAEDLQQAYALWLARLPAGER